MRYCVQIVGVGGQGVLLASTVVGNAAMRSGYKVIMSEVHGMAQRGGSVLCTVRFGDDVESPLEATGNANVILGFEPAETCRSLHLGNKSTEIIMNLDPMYPSLVAAGFEEYPNVSDIVKAIRKETGLRTVGATSLAEKAGKAVAANAVMIGVVAGVKGFPISKDVLKTTLLETVPEKFKDLNSKAFDLGYEHIRSSKG